MTENPVPKKGIFEIRLRDSQEMILRFRAFKPADVKLQLRKAEIGLKIPAENLEAVYITDWME
jgi:hypothetical protein